MNHVRLKSISHAKLQSSSYVIHWVYTTSAGTLTDRRPICPIISGSYEMQKRHVLLLFIFVMSLNGKCYGYGV